MTDDAAPPTLTDEERAAGWRVMRLGTGPWQKIAPGTKLAADYGREHRARVRELRAKVMTLRGRDDDDDDDTDR